MMPHTPHNPPDRLFQKYKAKGIRSDHVARYYATVEWFDETCGELLAYLDRKGLRENTLIIYTGDNGWLQDPNSENFIPGSKQAPQDAGIRQPIIFNWPGAIPASPRSVQLASTVDIAPTILGFAGAEIPAAMTGYNLRECLTAGTPTPRHPARRSFARAIHTTYRNSATPRRTCSTAPSSMANGSCCSLTTEKSMGSPSCIRTRNAARSCSI